MVKRLASIFLLLALGAGVASGAPLRSGGSECGMEDSMEMMECCKRARMLGNTPEIQAARLCCAVNCQKGGASGAASSARISAPQTVQSHPAAAPAAAATLFPRARNHDLLSHPSESPPVYLLNLTFLI